MRVTTYEHNDAIRAALLDIPPRILHRVHLSVFTSDPLFAGLHRYEQVPDGRSYRNTAHVAYPCHQTAPHSQAIMILPPGSPVSPDTIRHEFGHLLHETVDFWPHAAPVTEYAERDIWEAFAEAFAAWVNPAYLQTSWGVIRSAIDERTGTFFRQLAAGF